MLQGKLRDFNIILASGSPRRQQFLNELGIDFEVRLKPVEEIFPLELEASQITDYLAELKAASFSDLKRNDILITSDTIVWHKGKALGKPKDSIEAEKILSSLSAETHEVITSVCFKTKKFSKTINCSTFVTFKDFTEEEIQFYIDTFQPFDKAGGYGIQEWIGLIGIHRIEGSYPNVVGLPTHLIYENLLQIAEDLKEKNNF
ncbi:MAG TPA: Maf family nucleotide pyrophosphatase [Salinimicrobium sp.]|nr:Maf family nucleotide pyrophosphatase [Salinimicrobium sp.]